MEKSRQELVTIVDARLPSNNQALITAGDARSVFYELIESLYNKVDDQINNNISVPQWSNVISYPVNFIVEYDTRFWKSTIPDNLNHVPSDVSVQWTEVSKASASQNIDLSQFYYKLELQTAGQAQVNKENISPAVVEVEETLQATIESEVSAEADKYVSVRRFWQGIARFLGLANVWTALQSFNVLTTKQAYTTKQTFVLTGASPSQAISLDNGSYISIDLTAASGTATITLSNGKVGASYWIEFLQAATAVSVELANVGRYDGETGATIAGSDGINFDVIALYTGSGFKINVMEVS